MTRTPRLRSAFDGRTRTIDAGLMTIARSSTSPAIGFDARDRQAFQRARRKPAGRWPYVVIGIREGCRYEAVDYDLELDGARRHVRALLIAFANGREYGIGARIAPQAELDDGLLDATVVEYRPLFARFWDARHLATGTAHRARSVSTKRVTQAMIESDGPMEFHVDGELGVAERRIEVKILPGALKVRVGRTTVV